MRLIGWLAVGVFKESVRERVLYGLVLFAAILMAATYLLGQLTAGQDIKMVKDLGLAAISTLGLFMAIFIGISLVWKEVERRSIYNVLSKPVTREQFLLGKYAGLALTLTVNIAGMTLAFYAVLAYMDWTADDILRRSWPAPALDPALMTAIGLIVVELLVVTAVALFFSTFSSPFLSAVLTLGLWIVGHFNDDLRHFETVVDNPVAVWLARALYYVLPDLSAFDVRSQVVHGLAVPPVAAGLAAAYGAAYIVFLLVAAILVFRRRDLQ
jgi:ABC-type transport system involved in multi-copper enzyme maturation permease subunit